MCDYSLENVASRPAVVGDKLTVTKFRSVTTGFSAAEDSEVAVCVLPGTELAFDAPIRKNVFTDSYMGGREEKTLEHNVAVFTQILRSGMTWGYHKDALEMADGQKVLLNDLASHQTATVLQLPKQSTISHVELLAGNETAEPNAPVVQVGAPYYTEIV
jgi:hypothetical protein